jgi:hypothetical protein
VGVAPEGATGPGIEHLRRRLLDHVTLQHRADDQAGRPVRQHQAKRHVQPIQPQPVAVVPQVGHRQPAGQLHPAAVAGVCVVAPAHAVAAMRCMTLVPAVAFVGRVASVGLVPAVIV